MIEHFKQSGHPLFRGTRVLNRGILKKNGGRSTIQFSAESSNIELLFRTKHSANQLSFNGAESSWCEDLAEKMHGQTSMGVDKSMLILW